MRYTDAPRRREELLRLLRATGYVSAALVAAELDVSEMTIRRDLHQLADEGLAARVTGGARLPDGAGVPFEVRTDRNGPEKTAIARAASELLDAGATVALDSGTTVARLTDTLAGEITVVTHSVPVISACSERGDVRLIGLGGVYHSGTRSFSGSAVRAALSDLAVDVAVLSATSIENDSVYCTDPYDADTKRALVATARSTVVAVDSSKFSMRAPIRFSTLEGIDVVVTDDAAPADTVAAIRDTGVRVVLAPREAAARASDTADGSS